MRCPIILPTFLKFTIPIANIIGYDRLVKVLLKMSYLLFFFNLKCLLGQQSIDYLLLYLGLVVCSCKDV